MSSQINAISGGFAMQCCCNQLSITTRQKLESLGIDPSTITSEVQAQILIERAEAAKEQNSEPNPEKHKQNTSKTGLNPVDSQAVQENIFNAMDMISISNKFALGL